MLGLRTALVPPLVRLLLRILLRAFQRQAAHAHNMPWREVIFTESGAVYPASWNMNTIDISESMGPTELPAASSFVATPPHVPNERLTIQDLFERARSLGDEVCAAPPESHAAPSNPGIDDRAALSAETLPFSALRTDADQDPLIQRSFPALSEGHPRCRLLSLLATRDPQSLPPATPVNYLA